MKVIVYGTLKKGGRLSSYLDDSEYIIDTVVTGFKMYDSKSGFPFAVKTDEDDDWIWGEKYDVHSGTLRTLDIVESVQSGLFKRIDLREMKQNLKEPIYIYVSTLSKMSSFGLEPEEIESGRWKV